MITGDSVWWICAATVLCTWMICCCVENCNENKYKNKNKDKDEE